MSSEVLQPPASLYSKRAEWSDLQPVPQYESFTPLAPIYYTEEYKDATDYFRAIVRKGEMSNRVLDLTEDIIRLNPAHYSAWQYRYKTLLAIKSPLDLELRLMDELAVKYLKTYQVWHHRRLLLMHMSSSPSAGTVATVKKELSFIEACFAKDEKNYHTWSYRQWLLAHFNHDELWEGELPFVEKLLGEDVRNNSAWHHRFFVIFDSGVRKGDEDREEVVRREVSFTKQKISLAPNNASAWNYIRGILDRTRTPYSSIFEFVMPYAERGHASAESSDVIDLENPRPSVGAQFPCVPAIEFLADIREAQGDEDGILKAVQLYKSLADEHDIIRKKCVKIFCRILRDLVQIRYWEHRIKEASQSVTQ